MFKIKTLRQIFEAFLLMVSLVLFLPFTSAYAQEASQAITRPCRTVSLYVDNIYINNGGDDGPDGDAEWYMDMFVNGSLFEFNDDNVDTGETKPSRSTSKFDPRTHIVDLTDDTSTIDIQVSGYEYDDTSPNDPLPTWSWSHGSEDNWGLGQQRSEYVHNFEFAYTIYYTIACLTPLFADLQVTLTESQDPVMSEGRLNYTLSMTNNGPADAQSVTLNAILPNIVTFLEVNHSGCSLTGSTVICELGVLRAHTFISVEVVVRINPLSSGKITMVASTSLSPDNEDPDTSDNAISENTDIQQVLFLPIIRK